MNWKPLFNWMAERHRIYIRRFMEKKPWPWTKDKILQTYSFCNVYRELDRVTIWVRDNIRKPYADHPNLPFMLAVARQINWPDTLQEIMDEGGWPVRTWDPKKVRKIMLARQARGDKLYTGAYILNGQLGSRYKKGKDDKAYYTCHVVLQSAWDARKEIAAALSSRSMQMTWGAFLKGFGWGPFTAYEVVCDLRYTRHLRGAVDRLTWANAGPGAKRGLDRLLHRKKKDRPSAEGFTQEMVELHGFIAPRWRREFPHYPPLELREIEHSLCEFDKYERARRGQGRPKATYQRPEESK